MKSLLENLKDKNTNEKMIKPDLSNRTGRSFWAFFLQTKFKQIINFDKKQENPIIISIKDDFLDRFASRLVERPQDKVLVAISGESASGKSTICKKVREVKEKYNLPLAFMSTDNYFKDISSLIKNTEILTC